MLLETIFWFQQLFQVTSFVKRLVPGDQSLVTMFVWGTTVSRNVDKIWNWGIQMNYSELSVCFLWSPGKMLWNMIFFPPKGYEPFKHLWIIILVLNAWIIKFEHIAQIDYASNSLSARSLVEINDWKYVSLEMKKVYK